MQHAWLKCLHGCIPNIWCWKAALASSASAKLLVAGWTPFASMHRSLCNTAWPKCNSICIYASTLDASIPCNPARKMSTIQKHPYHLVDPSPWPLVSAISRLVTATGAAMFMHSFQNGDKILFLGIFMIVSSMFVWWRDVIREATFNGYHTRTVQYGLRFGMILFIVSEVMFSFAFFWAFFHSSLSPAIEIGSIWPPTSINPFDPWGVPLLNTVILLSSGATVTWAHHEILAGRKEAAKMGLFLTLILAVAFTALQAYEYVEASFTISDGVYGSTFFMATGFHGFHVIIGTIFLTVCLFRLVKNHFTKLHHFGFEAAAWYWHFVDVVWLFPFFTIYWWGNSI